MSRALFICILLLVGGLACPALLPAAADTPASLPDLSLETIAFTVGRTLTRGAPVGTASVNITVFVDDKGLDNLTSANVTVEINGTQLGVSPLVNASSGDPWKLAAYFVWNTAALPAFQYPVRAFVNDTAGDAFPADNVADTYFMIAQRAPSLIVALDKAVVQADITETAPGIADLTGNLTAADLFGQTLNISLTARTDLGWNTTVSPGTIFADKDGRRPFSARVIVPQGALATQSSVLTISAKASALDVDLSISMQAIVLASPYHRLTLDTNTPSRNIAPGDQAFFSVKLTNAGNAVDSFELEITNLKDLASKKWLVVLSANTLSRISPGDHKPFTVSAQSPRDWTLSKSEPQKIIIKATSLGAKDYQQVVSLTFPIYAYEKGSYPGWYNYYTIDLSIVLLVVAVVAGVWMWRRKRKAVPAA